MESTCRTHLSLQRMAQMRPFASISLQLRAQVRKGVSFPRTRGALGMRGSVGLWPNWNQPGTNLLSSLFPQAPRALPMPALVRTLLRLKGAELCLGVTILCLPIIQ